MKLETEFRLRLQLMQLEQAWNHPSFSDYNPWQENASTAPIPHLKPQRIPISGTWVKLLQAPGMFSSDEALLLCKLGETQWLAWIPDYGEITLDQDEFYELWDGMD